MIKLADVKVGDKFEVPYLGHCTVIQTLADSVRVQFEGYSKSHPRKYCIGQPILDACDKPQPTIKFVFRRAK